MCRRRGAAAVEFAVAVIVLLAFFFSGIEFYRVSMLRHTADHAAYVAARVAMIPGATAADAIASAQSQLDAVGVQSASIVISPNPITEETTAIHVNVSIPVPENSWLAPRHLFGTLTGSSILLTERAPVIMSQGLLEPPPPTSDDDDDDDDDDDSPPPPPSF